MSEIKYDKWKGVKAAGQDAAELVISAAGIAVLEALVQGGGFESLIGALGAAVGLDPGITTLVAVAAGKLAVRFINNYRKNRTQPLGQAALRDARARLRSLENPPERNG